MPYSPINQGLQHPGERVRFSHPLLTEESETFQGFWLFHFPGNSNVVKQESFLK